MATVSIKQARTLYTTFEILHEKRACKRRYKYLAKKLGGITGYGRTMHIPITKVYEICGPWDLGWVFNEGCFEPKGLANKVRLYLAKEIDDTLNFYDATDSNWPFRTLYHLTNRSRQAAYFKRWFGK